LSELRKFLFEGLPVRGMLVRITDAWTEVLDRRQRSNTGPYPPQVQAMLGEMVAAAVLMQSNINFEGALILQVMGDGPVKLAVVEVQSDLQLRATATLSGSVAPQASLADLVNPQGQARCVITLDPQDRKDGQQPYQGVVPLLDEQGVAMGSVAEALQFYMRQSEQLETTLVLASNEHMSAGLLIQRLPILGQGNLAGAATSTTDKEHIDETMVENYRRIATLASSLTSEELLTLDMDTVLHRLFWEEPLQQIRPKLGQALPHFGCTCSRERVSYMIQGLGQAEAQDILAEQGAIQVGCEFCGAGYRFDAVDTSQLFTSAGIQPPSSPSVQ